MNSTTPAVGRGFAVISHTLAIVVYLVCAVVALWPGLLEFNMAVRGGLAAFFLGRAGLSAVIASARARGEAMRPAHAVQGFLMLSYGYVASGILVGIGALWYGGVVGFLVAYAAFSLAWFWYWAKHRLGLEATRAHQSESR